MTYKATCKQTFERKSNFRLSMILADPIVIHCQFVIMNSAPELKKEDRRVRLMNNEHLIHELM